MKTISAKRLEMAGACEGQVSLFRSEWGDKVVRLTPENWDRAGVIGLDRLWMDRFLDAAARAECDKACDAAWGEYDKMRAAAQAECEKMCGAALFAALTGEKK